MQFVQSQPPMSGQPMARLGSTHAARQVDSSVALVEERLPFTVRVVRSEADLHKAVKIRHAAYARHVPAFAESLRVPEAYDAMDGVVVLLAESKLDGTALGTMRIQTNRYRPLTLEQSVALPQWLADRPLAEATRLGVTDRLQGRAVKTVLFKAFFLYCQVQQLDWMVITARSPIDRQYERLMFSDVDPARGYVALRHVGNLPHRIMSFEVGSAEARWAAADHPLFDFMFRTRHIDIDIGQPTHTAHQNWRGVNASGAPLMPM